ncbi:P-loop containing nucleoside triphosphate hydrolase protein [Xylariaceae sp. FL0594]|nr:P-loop containing nucleoside triphosphate hydrolase protein [Xylariaceae sp. FL0594]
MGESSDSSSTVAPSQSTRQVQDALFWPKKVRPAEMESTTSEEGSSSRSDAQSQGPAVRNFPPDFTGIGIMMKEVNDILGDLQLLGVSHDVPLPELVLVGDQSSGKSSLMSALARLNLPTSSGVCTRCPFHIHMRASKDLHWSCTVSLQQEYDYRPFPNGQGNRSRVTKDNPFVPWVRKPTVETTSFKTVYEQDSIGIDEILKWAQIATLNPGQNPQLFVPGEGTYARETDLGSAANKTEASFSPNVVFLEMRGPDFPPLSFYDLPGIISNVVSREDDYIVDVVENLTRKYVSREKAIVMLALPMDHDIEISKALRIIRDCNAEDRTIGALTKADRADFTQQDTKQRLGQGFFPTSLPPNIGLDDLRKHEDSSFRARSQWPPAFDEFGSRCGVDVLRVHVREHIGQSFTSSLPETKQKLGVHLHEVNRKLKELPEMPRNVEHEIRMCLKNFNASVRSAVGDQAFGHAFKQHTEEFYRCLVGLKPKCNMAMVPEEPHHAPQAVIISDSSDDEPNRSKRPPPGGTPAATRQKKRKLNEPFLTPVKSERVTTPTGRVGMQTPAISTVTRSPAVSRGLPFPAAAPFKMSLLDIQEQVKRTTRGGFGDIVPLEVYESLCLRAVREWETPLNSYIAKANRLLLATVNTVLVKSLGGFSRRLIFKKSGEGVSEFLKEKGKEQAERLNDIYGNEKYKVVTINEQWLNSHKAREKAGLERLWLIKRAKEAGLLDDDSDTRESLAELRSKLPEDKFKREIDIAATVRSYYLVAATRFTDAVSMDIDSRLFRSIREGALEGYLEEKLDLSPYPTPEKYSRLMMEEQSTSEKREELKKARAKFQTAIQKIETHELMLSSHGMPR